MGYSFTDLGAGVFDPLATFLFWAQWVGIELVNLLVIWPFCGGHLQPCRGGGGGGAFLILLCYVSSTTLLTHICTTWPQWWFDTSSYGQFDLHRSSKRKTISSIAKYKNVFSQSLFLRSQLTIYMLCHWSMQLLGTKLVTGYYLNRFGDQKCCFVTIWCHYASIS